MPYKKRLKTGESSLYGSVQNSILAIILGIALLGTLVVVGYLITLPKEGKPFTEFYILAPEGVAQGYPTQFIMQEDKVVSVIYGSNGEQEVSSERGRVILGIINQEYEESTYLVSVVIDGEQVEVSLDGNELDEVGPIVLAHEEKWEHEIGFSPQHISDRQKVEFILYKDGAPYLEEPLYLWIDVKE